MSKQLTQAQIDALETRHGEERQRIRDAASELVQASITRPTIEDLRIRSGLSERWKLTTRHIDLKDAFLRSVNEKWGREAPQIVSLQRKYDDLLAKYERVKARADELEELVETYAAVIEELSRQPADPQADNVRHIY